MNVPRNSHESNGRMAGAYMPGKNDDGLCDKWIKSLLDNRDPWMRPNISRPPHDRLVVGAANAGVKRRRRRTVMDSGAGRPIFDDDELYEPSSKRAIEADVVWGDGSTQPAAYEGTVGPLDGCINTGGASEDNLISVGSTIDSLQRKYKRKICMVFDDHASYIFKDVCVAPSLTKRRRYTLRARSSSNGMKASTRMPNSSDVYHVPLHDRDDQLNNNHNHESGGVSAAPAAVLKKGTKQAIIFDDNVQLPSKNQSNIEAELRRLHNCWGHPGPAVMRLMLLQSGTQRHKRLAKKVYELQPTCNHCLEGTSQAASHQRVDEQPTSKATRPLQRVSSDCTGPHNIATLSGARIAFIIVDQYCKYCWLWLISSTSQVLGIVKLWLLSVIKQKRRLKCNPGEAIMFWRSDNGPDFPKKFTRMLSTEFGIEHERTAAKASQQDRRL